jgi:aldose sugar dehydrogenase
MKRLFFNVILFGLTTNLCFGQNEKFTRTQIGANKIVATPWDLEYGPDGYLWITERVKGIVTRINPQDATRDDLIKLPDIYSTAAQDGLCGMLIQKEGTGQNISVYLAYTYFPNGVRRQKIVKYAYEKTGEDGKLVNPVTIIEGLPASNDHNSARLVLGPDNKLYYTIGDQGNNQNANFCKPIVSQLIPTAVEITNKDYTKYPGKILRLNLDGSIPTDNPTLEGVKSHIYSYGHRNPQGLIFGKNGVLYSSEHGPDTDDEINIIEAGKNYGWPNIVGYQDNEAYDFCNWSTATNCAGTTYSKTSCPQGAQFMEEKMFAPSNLQGPLLSMFAVKDDYNFNDPNCQDSWVCRPNVAPSSLSLYEGNAIPNWNNSLLIPSLKRGRIYRLKLDNTGKKIVGDTIQYFYSPNRYRDIAIHPDGKTFYMITDEAGRTSGPDGRTVVTSLANPAAIFKFTYVDPLPTKDETLESLVKVWPNPVSDVLQIELNNQIQGDVNATLMNLTGRTIKNLDNLTTGLNSINLSDVVSGMYIINIQAGGQNSFRYVVVE